MPPLYTLTPGTVQKVGHLPFALQIVSGASDQVVGSTFYVSSVITASGGNGTKTSPYATLAQAITAAAANHGDMIFCMPGHAENVTTAAGITTGTKHGITIVGLGVGAQRPTFSFSGLTTATMTWTANNVMMKNVILKCALNLVVSPLVVSGTENALDIETQDGSASLEFVRPILTTAAADNLVCKLTHRGFIAGTGAVNAIRLVGCNGARIDVDYYGKVSTAVVEFVTTACDNVEVTGRFYVSGTSNFSKSVVDTISGSVWTVRGFDAVADKFFSGGDQVAVATDPSITAVTDALYGATGIATWPAGAAPANAVSISEAIRWMNDAIQEAAGVVTYPTAAAYANGVSLAEVIAYIQDAVRRGTGTILPANTSIYDILAGTNGIPTAFTTAAAPAAAVSMAAVLREIFDQADKSVASATAVLTNNGTIFTIAGGPIDILSLVSICQVTNGQAAATTLQWRSNPTVGTATTISAASGTLAGSVAGDAVLLDGTALNTALTVIVGTGVTLGTLQTRPIIVPIGTIQSVVGTGPSLHTWIHYLRYRPLGRGVTVT